MNPAQFRVHIEAYLNLRSSLGFQTEYESYNLRELSDYVEAKGFSWPIRTQAILDWIGAASLHCGLPGQRIRLTHARCFLKHLRASVPDTEVPGPGLLPHEPRPKPRWYSAEEIAKLQQATSCGNITSPSERPRCFTLRARAVRNAVFHCGPLLPARCELGLPSVATVVTASCSPALGVRRCPPTGPPTSFSRLCGRALPACPTLKAKRVSPHVIRHTTAMHLLQSGVEIAVIALWLGHESLDTTHMYIQADLKTKDQALGKLQPVEGGFPRFKPDDALLAFLSAL
jgi:hypothetical protein